MKNQKKGSEVEKSKVTAIVLLTIISIVIIFSGAVFSVFSLMYDIHFPVLGSQIPGVIFGVVVAFLGVRYYLSVRKLKIELYKTTSRFSWSNFKKEKGPKTVSKGG